MKPPRSILQVAAVVSSALLVAGFVSYRAGAFDWHSRSPEDPAPADPGPTVFPSTKRAEIARPTDAPTGTAPADPAVLSGSKSAMVLIPPSSGSQAADAPPPAPAPAPAPKGPPAFIGGSKSIAPLIPPKAPPAPSPTPSDPK